MKKTYIIPTQKVTDIETESLIAESNMGINATSIEEESDILVKDQFASKNLWDSLW